MTMGAQSVSLMKPNLRESFSRARAELVAGSAAGVAGVSAGTVEAVTGGGLVAGESPEFSDELSGLSLQDQRVRAVRERRMVLHFMMMDPTAGIVQSCLALGMPSLGKGDS